MKSSIKMIEIWGIPIKLHISFLIILPPFAWLFANSPFFFQGIVEPWLAYTLGTLLTLMFFLCVLLHELGHSYVALKYDIPINSITLMIFGGVAAMEETPDDPSIELKLAIAGPLVSLAIGIVLLAINYLAGLPTPIFPDERSLAGIFIGWLGYINIIVAAFNLIPAFPMDGGRVLRSIFAKRMPYLKATERAAGIGKAFAFSLGLVGLLLLPAGIWLILIAAFIYFGASQEEKSTKITRIFSDLQVKDLMTENVLTVQPETNAEELIELMMKKKHMGYPVTKNEKLVGIITFSDIRQIPRERRVATYVKDIMTKNPITVDPELDAIEALRIISRERIGRIPVTKNRQVVGIISRSDFTTAIELGEMGMVPQE
ncbi:Zn-dependent protease fused to CBS domain [Methanonatronarchaeum thermophilum]|uniref:Zinc metalloprotease n=1 Tax=Methanonatronarchaeum thermophilum TaxID=1927129 RepID=A0A1Y3GCQ4_9EURY|nr:CBS domain-containing protein [Methanonatronarchaeum thermophilum]OUJ19179.1 Zn-dependent protease fused to CBS domain [Methanonatronarchaeum thermophilum]